MPASRILSFGTIYGDDQPNLRCPVCAGDYSHIREVFTRLGSDPHEGGHAYAGTRAKGRTAERRDALVIVFDGECGHAWELVIQQYKGINLAQVRIVPRCTVGCSS